MDKQALHDFKQPHSMFSTWIGVVLLFIVFGWFVLVVIGASQRGDTYEANRAKARMEKLEQARKEATTTLTSYGWVDKNKGVAHVPINRAMQLTIAGLAARKPMPAGPIATPEPANNVPATQPSAQSPPGTPPPVPGKTP